jgi:hypothetical protein
MVDNEITAAIFPANLTLPVVVSANAGKSPSLSQARRRAKAGSKLS